MSEEVTEAQAEEALRQLLNGDEDQVPQEEPQVISAEEAPEAQEASSEEQQEVIHEVSEEPVNDDIESLQQRLTEAETAQSEAQKRYEDQMAAIQQRYEENQKIQHERYLRKSSTADRALKALEKAKSEEGITQAEIDAIIGDVRSTMNPASPSYAEPTPQFEEDRNMVLNNFLNEQRMTLSQQNEFANWIHTQAETKMPQAEQMVAQSSIDGFLRLAHYRYQEDMRANEAGKRDDAVEAVKQVKRIQKEAAQASAPKAPRKQPTATQSDQIDISKLTDKDVGELIRQSVEQYQ